MLSAYESRGSIKAAAITAVLFGMFHFDITNLAATTFLGFLIGYYVIRTNSILAGMLAHFMNNALSELLQFLLNDGSTTGDTITISFEELIGTCAFGTVGLIVTVLLIMLFTRVTEGKCFLKPPISSVRKDIASILSHWPIIVFAALYIILAGLSILSMVMSRAMNL
jgi:hypothetical protein